MPELASLKSNMHKFRWLEIYITKIIKISIYLPGWVPLQTIIDESHKKCFSSNLVT